MMELLSPLRSSSHDRRSYSAVIFISVCLILIRDPNNTILPDGREAVFGLYKKISAGDDSEREYELLGEYADMQDVLLSCVIGGIPFAKVIIDEETELIGQD